MQFLLRPLFHSIVVAFALMASDVLADGACMLPPGNAAHENVIRVDTQSLVAGVGFDLSWQRPDFESSPCEGPLWLVLTLPEEARFTGDGFMAMAAGDPVPLNLANSAEGTRLFVPFHLSESDSGSFSVSPFLIGTFVIDWAIYHQSPTEGGTAIGAERIATGSLTLDVQPGRPRVVVQDLFSTQTPTERIRSNSGRFLLEVFDGHFRVSDAGTGALIYASYGHEPNFSPTSRFVHALGQEIDLGLDDPVFNELTVVDLISEEVVLQTSMPTRTLVKALHWSPGDSFLTISAGTWGEIGFKQVLTDRPIAFHGSTYARQNTAEETGFIDIDPDAASARMGHGRSGEPLFMEPVGIDLLGASRIQEVRPPSDPAIAEGWRMDLGDRVGRSWRHHAEWLDGPDRAEVVTHERLGDDYRRREPLSDFGNRGAVPLFRPRSAGQEESRFASRLADTGIDLDLVPDFDTAFMGRSGDDVTILLSFDPAEPLVDAGHVDPAFSDQIRYALAGAYIEQDATALECAFKQAQSWAFLHDGVVEQYVHVLCIDGSASTQSGTLSRMHFDDGTAQTEILADTHSRDVLLRDASGTAITFDVSNALRIFRMGGGLTAVASQDGTLAIVDAETATVRGLMQRDGFHDQIVLASITRDGRHVAIAELNGRFQVYPVEGGDPVLEGRYLDDEIVIFDRDFRFDGTPEGARHAHLKFAGDRHLYTLDQFANALRRPGTMADRLAAAADSALVPPLEELVPVPLPPRIEPRGAENPAAPLAGPHRLAVRVHARAGIGSVALFRDGREIERRDGAGGQVADLEFELKPLPETRSFALLATDRDGITSQVLTTTASHPPEAPTTGRLLVLAIGTDRYDDPAIADLRYAVSDARSMVERMADAESPYYRSVEAHLLADSPDLSEALVSTLDTLLGGMSENDTLFLHIAGHGVLGDDQELYVVGRTSRADDLRNTSLAWRDLVAVLERSRGRVMAFLDICHSGAAGDASHDVAVEGLSLAARLPIAVLAASKGRQLSLEGPLHGGGLFTSALLRALLTEGPDQAVRDVQDLSQIYSSLKSEVVEASGGTQTPWIARSGMVGAIPLF